MGTRSLSILVSNNKVIKETYVHFDGYLSYLGAYLFNLQKDQINEFFKYSNFSGIDEKQLDFSQHSNPELREVDNAYTTLKHPSLAEFKEYFGMTEDSINEFDDPDEARFKGTDIEYIYLYDLDQQHWRVFNDNYGINDEVHRLVNFDNFKGLPEDYTAFDRKKLCMVDGIELTDNILMKLISFQGVHSATMICLNQGSYNSSKDMVYNNVTGFELFHDTAERRENGLLLGMKDFDFELLKTKTSYNFLYWLQAPKNGPLDSFQENLDNIELLKSTILDSQISTISTLLNDSGKLLMSYDLYHSYEFKNIMLKDITSIFKIYLSVWKLNIDKAVKKLGAHEFANSRNYDFINLLSQSAGMCHIANLQTITADNTLAGILYNGVSWKLKQLISYKRLPGLQDVSLRGVLVYLMEDAAFLNEIANYAYKRRGLDKEVLEEVANKYIPAHKERPTNEEIICIKEQLSNHLNLISVSSTVN